MLCSFYRASEGFLKLGVPHLGVLLIGCVDNAFGGGGV